LFLWKDGCRGCHFRCCGQVSMAIVYVYFSKAAVAGEGLVAIMLCMGVAAFDIVLLMMRWLWFEQYMHYG